MHVQKNPLDSHISEGPMKIVVCRNLTLEVYSTFIEYEDGKAKPAHYLVQIVDCDDLNNQRKIWALEDPVHLVIDHALSKAVEFFNIYHQCWPLIEQRKTIRQCGNTRFTYDREFDKYMKIDGVVLENIYDYLFDIEVKKFLSKNGKKYLFELFEEWDPEHLKQTNKDFNDYRDNNGLEDITGEKSMQNLNNDY